MKQLQPDEVKVGHWYTFCCAMDRDRISNEELLRELLETSYGSNGSPFRFYATEEDLISEEGADN